MDEKETNELINKFIGGSFCQVNYLLLKLLGPEKAVWLSFVWDKWQYFKKNGMLQNKLKKKIKREDKTFYYEELPGYWFFLVKENIYDKTNIPVHRQTEIIQDLKTLGIISVEKIGLPHKYYYQINSLTVLRLCSQLADSVFTSEEHVSQLVNDTLPNQSEDSPSTSEGTVSQHIISKYDTKKNISKNDCFINKTKIDFDKSSAGNDSNSSLATDSVAHKNNIVETKENNIVDLNKKVPRNLKQPVVKEKPKPVVTKEVENLIIFWNGLNIVTHRPNTKTYYEIANCLNKLMAGKFFDKTGPFAKYSDKKFTSQEITETMTRFALAATNFNYLPISDYKKILKKTGIIHFLHNPFGKQEKSLFLEYFENPPQLLKEETRLTTDDDPDTTKIIKSFWVKKVLGGIEPVSWSNQDENNFRRAGKSLTKFIKSNIKRITTEFGLGGDDIKAKRDRVELLFEAILDDINDDTSKLTTGWLCSSMTWNTRFPKYLFAQGIIREE